MSLEKEKKITPCMFTINRLYSITVNPEAQYEQDDKRIDKVIRKVKKKLDTLSLQYSLYAEISSPCSPVKNKFPRIHFHGTIYWENYVQLKRWYTNDYFRLHDLGYFEIDQLNDPDKWKEYCNKEKETMEHLTKHRHIASLRPIPNGNG